MADYSDLINKTIFDFCDDKKIIRKTNPLIGKDYAKDWYIEACKKHPLANSEDLYELACITNNEELKMAVEVQFKEFIDEYFNE